MTHLHLGAGRTDNVQYREALGQTACNAAEGGELADSKGRDEDC